MLLPPYLMMRPVHVLVPIDCLINKKHAVSRLVRRETTIWISLTDGNATILTAPMRMASASSIITINTIPLLRRSLSYGARQWLPVGQVLLYCGLLPGYTTSGRMGAVR